MRKLNTCEKCGHYDWVHKEAKCGLDYCNCGKEVLQSADPAETSESKTQVSGSSNAATKAPSASDPLPNEP